MGEMERPESVEEKYIRENGEKHVWALLQELPLLGQGNKFVKEPYMTPLVLAAIGMGATIGELADTMGICKATVRRHFAVELEKGGSFIDKFVKDSLLIGVIKARTNPAYQPTLRLMAFNRLGMTDKVQQDHTSSDGSLSGVGMPTGLPTGSRVRLLEVEVGKDGEANPASAQESEPAPPATPKKTVKDAKGKPKPPKTSQTKKPKPPKPPVSPKITQ